MGDILRGGPWPDTPEKARIQREFQNIIRDELISIEGEKKALETLEKMRQDVAKAMKASARRRTAIKVLWLLLAIPYSLLAAIVWAVMR